MLVKPLLLVAAMHLIVGCQPPLNKKEEEMQNGAFIKTVK